MSSNKTIFVISSNYLEAIHKESTKYKFELIGCGSFENACKMIQNVSMSSLLGVSILERQLPEIKSKDGKALLKFFDILGDLQQPVRVNIIILNGTLSSGYTKRIKQYENISCYCHNNAEAVTDSMINGEAFGSLLLTDTQMYQINKKADKTLANDSLKTININNYFSEYLLKVFGKYVVYADLEQTCIHDQNYREYADNGDEMLKCMREWYIGIRCNFDVTGCKDKVYELLMQNIDSETFPDRFCLYSYLEDLD